LTATRSGVPRVAHRTPSMRSATRSDDKTVKMRNARTGKRMGALLGHTCYIGSVAFSPDGTRIASGGELGTRTELRVWDAETGQLKLSLKGHAGGVLSVAFSPDGRRIASGSLDQTVKVWDAQTGQEKLTLKGHTISVHS